MGTAVAAGLWGTSFPVISIGLNQGIAPGTFLFLRFALAAPLMVLISVALHKDVAGLLRTRGVWTLGFVNAVGFVCQFYGQQDTTASVAALLVNLSVVIAAAGGVVFLGERLGGLKAAGVGLAFFGTVLIATNGDPSTLVGGRLLGDSLYLISAMSWAAYIVYAKKKTDELGWDPLALASSIVVSTVVFVFPFTIMGGFGAPTQVSWSVIAYTAVLNTAIPFVLYQQGLRYLSAGTSAVLLMLEIVVALLVSGAFLGEQMTPAAWIGATAVLVSILLVSGLEVRSKRISPRITSPHRVHDLVPISPLSKTCQVSSALFASGVQDELSRRVESNRRTNDGREGEKGTRGMVWSDGTLFILREAVHSGFQVDRASVLGRLQKADSDRTSPPLRHEEQRTLASVRQVQNIEALGLFEPRDYLRGRGSGVQYRNAHDWVHRDL